MFLTPPYIDQAITRFEGGLSVAAILRQLFSEPSSFGAKEFFDQAQRIQSSTGGSRAAQLAS